MNYVVMHHDLNSSPAQLKHSLTRPKQPGKNFLTQGESRLSNPRLSREIGFHLEPYIKLDVWFREIGEEVERIRRKGREYRLKVDRASSGKAEATSIRISSNVGGNEDV